MDGKGKKMYCSQEQKHQLIEMVTGDRNLLSGKFNNNFTAKDCTEKWQGIAEILNSIPGANKDWRQWKKTWQDLKCTAKKKKTAARRYMEGTGGGPPIKDTLTPTDEAVLDSLNSTVVSGCSSIMETRTVFEWEDVDVTVPPSISSVVPSTEIPNVSPEVPSKVNNLESKRKRLTPAKRRAISASATQVLAQVSERDSLVKESYYKQKIQLLERQTLAIEKIASHFVHDN